MKGTSRLDDLIAQLRHLLENSKEFSESAKYFYDVVMLHPDFLNKSLPNDEHPLLQSIFRQNLVQLFQLEPGFQVVDSCFMQIPELGFWHGFYHTHEGHILQFFYFEESTKGLIIATKGGPSGQPNTYFLRFTAVPVPKGTPMTDQRDGTLN